jgi:hypothetical protein
MILGGIKGLPYWAVGSAAYSILNAAFGSDENKTKDFEAYLREHLGPAGLLLTKGMPAALGVDMSAKLGMGNVMSIAPFSDIDLSSKSGYEKALVGLSGPFAGGMLPNMADGIGMLAQGDYYKGLEKFMPTGASNAMKAYRFKTDGVTNRNGDMVMSPDDIAFTDAAMQAAGLPTTKLTERSYRAEELRKTEQYYSNTEKNITHSFTKAAKENNTNAMQRAQEEFMQLQNQRAANGFTRQPMSTLYKSAQAQRKREQSLVGGVETTKQNVQHERELANE